MPADDIFGTDSTAFSGPAGVSYAANLTPGPDTGLGVWTEDVRQGASHSETHGCVTDHHAPNTGQTHRETFGSTAYTWSAVRWC